MSRKLINSSWLRKSTPSDKVSQSNDCGTTFWLLISYIDTVLAYKQRNKVGRFAPPVESQPPEPTATPTIPIGSRCQVESSEAGLNKRGIVRFFGKTKFSKGESVWVGIEYDEPMGKNDGS